MADGTVMKDSDMPGGDASSPTMSGDQASSATKPSATASMICSDEIADAVKRNFALPENPTGTPSWDRPVFRCDWRLPEGHLRMQVADLSPTSGGRAYFTGLRGRLSGATPIRGMANFGLPAFETPRGDVVFLKDGKTLWVDPHEVTRSDLPPGFTPTAVAYGVAAAVIACWSE